MPCAGSFTAKSLITFENSLDPDKAQHFVGPDLDPNCLTLWWYSWNNHWKKLILKKIISRRQKGMKNYPVNKELIQMSETLLAEWGSPFRTTPTHHWWNVNKHGSLLQKDGEVRRSWTNIHEVSTGDFDYKNLSWLWGWDRKIRPEDHYLASHG